MHLLENSNNKISMKGRKANKNSWDRTDATLQDAGPLKKAAGQCPEVFLGMSTQTRMPLTQAEAGAGYADWYIRCRGLLLARSLSHEINK